MMIGAAKLTAMFVIVLFLCIAGGLVVSIFVQHIKEVRMDACARKLIPQGASIGHYTFLGGCSIGPAP